MRLRLGLSGIKRLERVLTALLARVHGHWAVIAHPEMRFKTLPPPV